MNRISAKVVADSISPKGDRITTMEVTFPRFILAEFNTHRMLSRNSASSRAIPFPKMIKSIQQTPFIPIAWQKDHKGMQGFEYFEGVEAELFTKEWVDASKLAMRKAKRLSKLVGKEEGRTLTKQLLNRTLEPFLYHKVLVTATEWENFFNLRCPQYKLHEGDDHQVYKSWKSALENYPTAKDASILDRLRCNKGMGEIHIMDLAEKMYDALNESTPNQLKEGEWHIPYGDNIDLPPTIPIEEGLTLEQGVAMRKVMIATARCARLSYQTLGDNPKIDYDKDLELYQTLYESGHFSPFEHCAQVMTEKEYYSAIKGNLHLNQVPYLEDESALGWSANFKGFNQYRVILEGKFKNK